ncbi:hypothetical protein [Spirosoma foliorum]|uniref:Uncharacterized protein n=1 Tax=Spirosoma foliorum TaxID=2710596 RepID=A0A7G5H0F5_9BACT|nr:hypothetical protein [Spirosoma foliorum]QMW04597.1 hypothetical protein H3H32_06600 [Spirosoma foliorum]
MRNLVLTIADSVRFQARSVQKEPLKWLLFAGVMLSLSGCSNETEKDIDIDRIPSGPDEKQALNKWISTYLHEVVADTETVQPTLGKSRTTESAIESRSSTQAATTNLNGDFISWYAQTEPNQKDSLTGNLKSLAFNTSDSSAVIANLLFSVPDSLVQKLNTTEGDSVLIVGLNITLAGDTILSREWTTEGDIPPIAVRLLANPRQIDTTNSSISVVEIPPNRLLLGDTNKALQNAALGPIWEELSVTSFTVPPLSTLSSLGSFIDRKSEVIEITIPVNTIH